MTNLADHGTEGGLIRRQSPNLFQNEVPQCMLSTPLSLAWLSSKLRDVRLYLDDSLPLGKQTIQSAIKKVLMVAPRSASGCPVHSNKSRSKNFIASLE
eukprot:CAMPEP_0115005802 /NCGR_PEP_ID=MMETSP0216-20121206/20104_1 /TAXON_ID=223996 /ORGANISM="Protocruzia adherens, Strain Boccale" /LENGTH=97 /DNA_ID=CAMNT_0002372229 /DNA_START=370 /DNA_END=660 /DNA_ORIENTATION=+